MNDWDGPVDAYETHDKCTFIPTKKLKNLCDLWKGLPANASPTMCGCPRMNDEPTATTAPSPTDCTSR